MMLLVCGPAMACATQAGVMPEELERRAIVDTAGTFPRTGAPAGDIPAIWLEGPAGLRALCDVLQDEMRRDFPGNEVEQARARAAHRSRRIEAQSARYQIDIPAVGFAFRSYDIQEERLELAQTSFVVGEGAELYRAQDAEPIVFSLRADAADRILNLHEGGSLTLRLVFRVAPSNMRGDLCLRMGGGIVKLAAEVAAAYLYGGQNTRLAEFETQAFAQVMAETRAIAHPDARVLQLSASDGSEAGGAALAATRTLEPRLLGCYQAALERRPGLRGKVVLALEVREATARSPRMQVSSLGDDALVACVVSVLEGARIAGARAGAHFLTVEFGPRVP